jgi:hypothetical protein
MLLRDPLGWGSVRRKVYVTFIILFFFLIRIDSQVCSDFTYAFRLFRGLAQASYLFIYVVKLVSVFSHYIQMFYPYFLYLLHFQFFLTLEFCM